MQARRLRYAKATLAITLSVAALLWLASRVRVTSVTAAKMEYTACDQLLFGVRGRLPAPPEVVVIAIDPQSIQNLGQWPFPRGFHAELIRRLNAMGAKVIAFDIVMDVARGNQDDRELVAACREAGNVVMAAQQAAIDDTAGGSKQVTFMLPFEDLRQVASIGTVNFTGEEDGTVRRAVYGHEVAGLRFPLLSVYAAARYLGVDPDKAVAGNALDLGRTQVPLDADGAFWIDYVGKQGDVRTLSYYQIVPPTGGPPEAPAEYVKDKIVFVGMTDPLQHDTVDSPFEKTFPGVAVHANVASMLVQNRQIHRLPDWWGLLLATLCAFLISVVAVTRRPPWAVAGLFVLAILYSAVAVVLFVRSGMWIPVVVPLLGAGAATVGGVLYRYLTEERERKRVSTLFSKYVSKDVAQALMDDPEASLLGRSRKLPVTCLFSDIRGFTSISERLSAEEVVAMLNEYFDRMVACVFENEGTLDKYVGDAIMATFGVPKSFGNDAERACRTAVRMREELAVLQKRWAEEGRTGMDIGIGINTGDAVVGNIGHHQRLEYTCIGDTINTASRLESANKEYGTKVLISQSTYDEVKGLGLFRALRLPPVHVKGKAEAVQVYELLGWATPGGEETQQADEQAAEPAPANAAVAG